MINSVKLVRKTCQDLWDALSTIDMDSGNKRRLSGCIGEIFAKSHNPNSKALKDQLNLDSFRDMSKNQAEVALACKIIAVISEGFEKTQIDPVQIELIEKLAEKLKSKTVHFSDDTKQTEGEGSKTYQERTMEEKDQQTFEGVSGEKRLRITQPNMKNMFFNYLRDQQLPSKEYLLDIFLETLDECRQRDILPEEFQALFMKKVRDRNVRQRDLFPELFVILEKNGYITPSDINKPLRGKHWKKGERKAEVFQLNKSEVALTEKKSAELFESKSFQECLKTFLKSAE